MFEFLQSRPPFKLLLADPSHVVIVNCNAGKGRTGTSIASFLMFSGLSENARDAITFYGWQRFEHGNGVTQPSQVRYIHYFEKVYKRLVQGPVLKILDKIVVTTVPKISSKGCTPFVEVLNGKDFETIWTNRNSSNLRHYRVSEQEDVLASVSSQVSKQSAPRHQKIVLEIDSDPILVGDIYFRLIHRGNLGNKLICRFALNTSFIQNK